MHKIARQLCRRNCLKIFSYVGGCGQNNEIISKHQASHYQKLPHVVDDKIQNENHHPFIYKEKVFVETEQEPAIADSKLSATTDVGTEEGLECLNTARGRTRLANSASDPSDSRIKNICECPSQLISILDQMCRYTYEMHCPSEEIVLHRREVCDDLERFLRQHCHHATRLELFGSSINGFLFPNSDLDICLTFEGGDANNVSKSVLLPISQALEMHPKFYRVSPISRAKVPIVRFRYRSENIPRGDISLYNKLGVRNSHLLAVYSKIDIRFKMLGYMLKHLMTTSSKCRLSSYACILLVVHYLQQCTPPVLPVLQELFDAPKQPQVLEDGWNSWFYDDIKNLSEVWSEYGKNTASVGELWFGLLHFYANVFDFENDVVCIRRKKPMNKNSKMRHVNRLLAINSPQWKRKVNGASWAKRPILIEDPFDLGHNLACSLKYESSVDMIEVLFSTYRKLEVMAVEAS